MHMSEAAKNNSFSNMGGNEYNVKSKERYIQEIKQELRISFTVIVLL